MCLLHQQWFYKNFSQLKNFLGPEENLKYKRKNFKIRVIWIALLLILNAEENGRSINL